MEIKDIRMRNLNLLADQHGRTAIAEKLGYPDNNYINQLCGGHTNLGSRTARKVESAFGLPTGWMDYPQWEGGVKEALGRNEAQLLPEEVVELIALIEEKARDGSLTSEHAAVLKSSLQLMTMTSRSKD